MSKTLDKLITRCVLRNVVFQGMVGSTYTVQDLMHSAKQDTINKMGQSIKRQISSLNIDSFKKTSNSAIKKSLQLQFDTLEEIYAYNENQAAIVKARATARKSNVDKLALLRGINAQNELEALGKLDPEDVKRQIAALEISH